MANSYLTPKKKQTDDLDRVFDFDKAQSKKQKAKYGSKPKKKKKK